MRTPNSCCVIQNLIKYGFRKTKCRGKIQRYKCLKCKTVFVFKSIVRGMRYDENTVVSAVLLHLEGLTESDISDFLGISWRTVERWLEKFGKLLDQFCSKFKPQICRTLHCDEMFLKMLGFFLYVWDSITRESKWLTIKPSLRRDKAACKKLLQRSPRPTKQTITDGAFSYLEPIRSIFGRQIEHIIACGEKKSLNNFIEGLQSVIRRFTRPRRGFKKIIKAIKHLTRYQHYYNFVKNNLALGMPPAQKLRFIDYPSDWNKKQRLQFLLEKAIIFWLKIFTKN